METPGEIGDNTCKICAKNAIAVSVNIFPT